jgi:hypothetical protein
MLARIHVLNRPVHSKFRGSSQCFLSADLTSDWIAISSSTHAGRQLLIA